MQKKNYIDKLFQLNPGIYHNFIIYFKKLNDEIRCRITISSLSDDDAPSISIMSSKSGHYIIHFSKSIVKRYIAKKETTNFLIKNFKSVNNFFKLCYFKTLPLSWKTVDNSVFNKKLFNETIKVLKEKDFKNSFYPTIRASDSDEKFQKIIFYEDYSIIRYYIKEKNYNNILKLIIIRNMDKNND